VNGRRVAVALAFVVAAVVLQGALFGEGRIHPFGASPSLVTLVVIGAVRHLEPEPAMLVGFTGGLLTDLLGGSALGLWAMTLTVVAYVTLRVRDRADDGPLVIAVGVFVLTLMGHALFALTGTLFGQRTLVDPDVTHLMILPSLYTMLLAAGILPLLTVAMRGRRNRGWAA
jgi:rod shape-determining protein MreD